MRLSVVVNVILISALAGCIGALPLQPNAISPTSASLVSLKPRTDPPGTPPAVVPPLRAERERRQNAIIPPLRAQRELREQREQLT